MPQNPGWLGMIVAEQVESESAPLTIVEFLASITAGGTNPGWLGMITPDMVEPVGFVPFSEMFPPYVPGQTNIPVPFPIYNNRTKEANIQITGGGGGSVLFQTGTLPAGDTVIFCLVNSGVLPVLDSGVVLLTPMGVLLEGTDYTIDRVSIPNEITILFQILDDMNFVLLLSYPPA